MNSSSIFSRTPRRISRSNCTITSSASSFGRMGCELRYGSERRLGCGAAGLDAIRDADAVIRVASQMHSGSRGGSRPDFGGRLLMAQRILRHRTGPPRDALLERRGGQPEDTAKFFARDGGHRFIGFIQDRRIADTAEETAQDDAI